MIDLAPNLVTSTRQRVLECVNHFLDHEPVCRTPIRRGDADCCAEADDGR